MLKSNGNLGLSEAMIAAAREILEKKLTPAQAKNIDKNHNGKIDKGDFNILHKKKKMMEAKCPSCGKSPCMCESVKKEEVEHITEASLGHMAANLYHHLSNAHYGHESDASPASIKSSKKKADDIKSKIETSHGKDVASAIHHRVTGAVHADNSQVGDADSHEKIRHVLGDKEHGHFKKQLAKKNYSYDDDEIDRAMARHKAMKEEVEQIDEISLKKKIHAYAATQHPDADYNYGDKVHDQGDRIKAAIVKKHGEKAGEHADTKAHTDAYGRNEPGKTSSDYFKRDKLKDAKPASAMRTTKSGMINKQDVASKKNEIKSRLAKEEVEFSDAELEMIASIAQQHEVE